MLRKLLVIGLTGRSTEYEGRAMNVHQGDVIGTFDVEAFTAELEVIANWRDDLQRKLDRAALRFELCGLDFEEQEQLAEEVFAFTSVCRALADTLRRSQ